MTHDTHDDSLKTHPTETTLRPIQAIYSGLRKSFQFFGRSSLTEFWLFALFIFIVCHFAGWADYWLAFGTNDLPIYQLVRLRTLESAASAFGNVFTHPSEYYPEFFRRSWMGNFGFLAPPQGLATTATFLILVIPSLSILSRRARDAGFSPIVAIVAYFWPTMLTLLHNGIAYLNTVLQTPALSNFLQEISGPVIGNTWMLAEVTALFAIYVLISPSSPGPNRYGPNPLEVTP